VDELAAFVTKNNTAYAGAQRLQEKINSLDDDSTVPGVCEEDGNSNSITEIINVSCRLNAFSNASVIERSGGMFNLRRPNLYALEDKIEMAMQTKMEIKFDDSNKGIYLIPNTNFKYGPWKSYN